MFQAYSVRLPQPDDHQRPISKTSAEHCGTYVTGVCYSFQHFYGITEQLQLRLEWRNTVLFSGNLQSCGIPNQRQQFWCLWKNRRWSSEVWEDLKINEQ